MSAEKSTDTTPPTSTITSPQPGETIQDGSQVDGPGTATDAGGGVVAGVEVSTDNGDDLASGDAHHAGGADGQLVLHRGPPTATPPRRSNRAPWTTAPTSRRPRPA